jgi:biopolymer transport protein ExbB/TolQ
LLLSDTLASSSVVALAMANARIALLEAELRASQKAYDVAANAKANAKKSQKSALGKAKKAEKALANANKDHAQREQAVAERLHTMSTAAESECFALSSIFDFCCTVVRADIFLLLFFSTFFVSCRIYRGISVGPATGR